MFRFEQLWLQSEEECTEVVAEAWSPHILSYSGKISTVCGALDSWSRKKFGDLPKQIAKTKLLLQTLQRSIQTAETIEATTRAEAALDTLFEQEEVFWSQRSRATWLQHGDKNTSFFHKKASQRRQRNLIEEIKDDAGNKYVEDEDIAEVLKDYFSSLFTSSNPSDIEEKTTLVAGRITPALRTTLTVIFRREEVEEALFQMHPTKAPGTDGLPALFYQNFWHIIGDDVSDLCLSILHGHLSPECLNQTRLVLIPKTKKPDHANHFRPISLCNVIFKIITKTIANRLKLILPQIVDETQSAFVPNRLITDNALIAFECFHYIKKKYSGNTGVMALKLDMSKAYDRIEWAFLQSVMRQMGFPENWVNLIMECISTVTFSIMLNGNPQAPFTPHRGLRQGDPLSPISLFFVGRC
jgi:hypothetical protein